MILSLHMITGAIIGNKTNKKTIFILILVLLSHFVLDFIPHFEYAIKSLTLFLDLLFGIIIAMILAYQNRSKAKIILASTFIAILPDAPAFIKIILTKSNHPDLLNSSLNRLITSHNYFHTKLSFVVPTETMRIILLISILLAISYFIKIIIPRFKE